MNTLKRIWKIVVDILEIYIPIALFLILFLSFVIGIVYRYFLNNPQSWTYELSSICFLGVGILSACLVTRNDEHISFDMVYEKFSSKIQCVLRIVSNCLVCITAIAITPASIEYLVDMQGLTTQIIGLPRFLVFLPFPVMFINTAVRTFYKMVLEIKSFKNKTY